MSLGIGRQKNQPLEFEGKLCRQGKVILKHILIPSWVLLNKCLPKKTFSHFQTLLGHEAIICMYLTNELLLLLK